jgi:hypothetical protein
MQNKACNGGWFVVWSGMPKKNKKDLWWADIKSRALKTMTESRAIVEEVDRNYAKICKFVENYTEEKLEKMAWEEKEKMYSEADALFQRIAECEEILKRMDIEYDALRKEVNEYYGKEVMKDVPRVDVFEAAETEEAEGDESDWWKKQ